MEILDLLIKESKVIERNQLELRLKNLKGEGLIESYSFVESAYLEIDGEMFFNTSALNRYIEDLEVKERVRTQKAICACGSELVVSYFEGYYESFKYLSCQNEKCDFLDNQDVNGGKRKGAYA